jgi:hypothetical protein
VDRIQSIFAHASLVTFEILLYLGVIHARHATAMLALLAFVLRTAHLIRLFAPVMLGLVAMA